ncbi:hypothetical protein MCOR16_000068 [Pyricularia oryzae]|nr:hypothetical protein MCOR16_000068 [Pyricularia oryzae]
MAAVAPVQVNGLSTPSLPASPESSASSSKRKRDANDDEAAPKSNTLDEVQPTTNGQEPPKRDERELVRNVFEVLRRVCTQHIEPNIHIQPSQAWVV